MIYFDMTYSWKDTGDNAIFTFSNLIASFSTFSRHWSSPPEEASRAQHKLFRKNSSFHLSFVIRRFDISIPLSRNAWKTRTNSDPTYITVFCANAHELEDIVTFALCMILLRQSRSPLFLTQTHTTIWAKQISQIRHRCESKAGRNVINVIMNFDSCRFISHLRKWKYWEEIAERSSEGWWRRNIVMS